MLEHDAPAGSLKHCQICGSKDLRLIIDLGHQPPCDSLLTAAQLDEPEVTYPLRLNQCNECSLAQLDYVVPGKVVYPETYPYRAGISWPVVAAHKAMAEQIVSRFGRGLCVDIGCNDGTLLQQFKEQGCNVYGIEPTNIAQYARDLGIPVAQEFFNEHLGWHIAEHYGYAHVITMTNVFAHMAELGEVMRGICKLLSTEGVLVIENHYLLDILERNQFDSIYHEHIRTYTLKSLMLLFHLYGLEVFDVDRVPRYGGNIRVYVGYKRQHPVARAVDSLLETEEALGTYDSAAWGRFRSRVYNARNEFMQFMFEHAGTPGCSAPGRASTLLNFYGVTPDLMPWTGELAGSLKIGQYIPGCRVPIVSNKRIVEEQPEYLVLLAWHYAEQIETRLRNEGVRSKFIVPLPSFSEGLL